MKYLLLPVFFSFSMMACQEKTSGFLSTHTIGAGQVPALAKDDNNIHLVYGTGDSIMYAASTDKGISFSSPVLVDRIHDLIDFAMRGPQIAATKNGISIIAVNKAGDIFSFVKESSGNWIKTAKISDADTVNKEGFLGLSSNGENKLFAIWPDLRNDGYNKIYGAQSADGGKTWSKNVLVYKSPDSTVCECCKPNVLMQGDNVYVMFRNWLNGNRDLHLIQSNDAGASFGKATKLGNGSWKLDGCPMDGGGLVMKAQTVQTVWRRKDSIFSSVPNQQEQFIAKGKSCTITANNDNTVYAWTNDGKVYYKLNNEEAQEIGTGSLPVLAMPDEHTAICAWTENGSVKYRSINLQHSQTNKQ